MERVAVLSDIHANAQALEAVLDRVRREGIDKAIIAGDLVCDGPEPDRVIDLVRALPGACVIKGNKEDYVLSLARGERDAWKGPKQYASVVWTLEHIRPDNLDYLQGLTHSRACDHVSGMPIRVAHGSPTDANELLYADGKLPGVLSGIEEKLLIHGHSHRINFYEAGGKTAINPGSVGLPLYGDSRAQYGVLTVSEAGIEWEQRFIGYDREGYVRAMRESGLYDASPVWSRAVVESIYTGENVSLDFVRFAYALLKERNIAAEIIPDELWDEASAAWKWREDA